MEIKDMRLEGGRLVATVTMTDEDCRKFVNDVFNNVLGKDVDYVIQAVKEKMIRDGEIDGEEDISELSAEDISCEDKDQDDDGSGDK